MAATLIVGAGGFLGRHLTARLAAAEGTQVLTLGMPGRPAASLPSGAQRVEAAAWSAEAIAAAVPAGTALDTVYLLAAAGVDPSQRQPADLLRVNIELPQLVLEALALRGGVAPRVILTGTCSEYFPVVDGHLSLETDAAEGADTYGASKAAGAVWALKLARQLNIPLVHLRLFHFYGPGESPHRLISSLFRQLSAGQPVRLSPGEQYRDMLYIEDMLDALEAAAAAPAPQWETLNVCSGRPVKIADVARAASAALAAPERLLQLGALDYRPGEVMWIAGDATRFRNATGWRPRFTLEDGIGDMLRQSRQPAHA